MVWWILGKANRYYRTYPKESPWSINCQPMRTTDHLHRNRGNIERLPTSIRLSNFKDEQPLTPSHLLYGRRITALPHPLIADDEWSDPTFNEEPTLVKHLAKWRADLIHHFWNCWRKEYLTLLREFHKATGTIKICIEAGDVVQIHDDTKRINWRLAVVKSVITGKDGLIHAANVRRSTGRTNRPITKLYPVEVAATTKSTPGYSLVPSTHDGSIANSPLIDDN